jgi:hypothetical protein
LERLLEARIRNSNGLFHGTPHGTPPGISHPCGE